MTEFPRIDTSKYTVTETGQVIKDEVIPTANGIQWHKVTNWKNQEQFPQEENFPFVVLTKKDGFYLCEWEITEGWGQFYSMYEGEEIDPEDVIAWKEIDCKEIKEND